MAALPGRSVRASPHATILPIPSNSRHDRSTFPSHELRGRPLGLLHPGLSLTESTLCAGSTSRKRATCPYSWSWRSRTMLVTGLDSVSWSNCWFDTKSFQRYPMILRRNLVSKTLRRLSKSLLSDHVSQPYSKTGSTSVLKMQSFVLFHRYWQRHRLMLSESITPKARPIRRMASWSDLTILCTTVPR